MRNVPDLPDSQSITLARPLSGPALAETLDGGQCFRWRRDDGGTWHGVSGSLACELRETGVGPIDRPSSKSAVGGPGRDSRVYKSSGGIDSRRTAQPIAAASSVPSTLDVRLLAGTINDLRHHLADDLDWHALADSLPWRSDTHLATCIRAFPGLRILRQPIDETLLGFVCSATKQIVQIKQMLALLARHLGHPLAPCKPSPLHHPTHRPPPSSSPPSSPLASRSRTIPRSPSSKPTSLSANASSTQEAPKKSPTPSRQCHLIGDISPPNENVDALPQCHLLSDIVDDAEAVWKLPDWGELAGVSEEALRGCKLGFRARHVYGIARFLAERPGWLAETAALPYAEAKMRLIELPGVGEKIADCVLLFGAARLEAFPVDVWILRVMERHYGLTGWSPAQVAHFGRTHFGPLAGLAQQYLFAWERARAR